MFKTQEGKLNYLYFVLLVFLIFIFAYTVYSYTNFKSSYIVFLNVGQGDAFFIKDKNLNILVDTGHNSYSLLKHLDRYTSFLNKKLDLVFITHLDKDHAGALFDLTENFSVSIVCFPKGFLRAKNKNAQKIIKFLSNKGIDLCTLSSGDEVLLSSLKIKVLYPEDYMNPDLNYASLVLSLKDKAGNKVLLTGDLPGKAEKLLILKYGRKLKSAVLKLAHHGSKYSSTRVFLDFVKPKVAIVSVSKHNSYGHPSPRVIKELKYRGVQILYTYIAPVKCTLNSHLLCKYEKSLAL